MGALLYFEGIEKLKDRWTRCFILVHFITSILNTLVCVNIIIYRKISNSMKNIQYESICLLQY